MKISDKFPEIKFFIENPTAYEILYYQGDRIHNEYPLEVSEAKMIFNYMRFLEDYNESCEERIANLEKNNNQRKDTILRQNNQTENLEDSWNNLKKWLETNWEVSQDVWFVKVINKMIELEQKSDSNVK